MHFFLLITAIVLWGLMPIVLVPALKWYSPFSLGFARLSVAGVLFLMFGIILGKITRRKLFSSQNKLGDAAVLGVAIGFNITSFFVSIATAGPILTVGTGAVLPVVIIGILQSKGDEPYSYLKAVYLLSTACAAVFFAMSRMGYASFSPLSMLSLSLYIISVVIFFLFSERKKCNTKSLPSILARNGIVMLVGAGVVLLTAIVFAPFYGNAKIFLDNLIAGNISYVFPLLSEYVILLVVVFTLIPYLAYMYSTAIWPRESMTFSQWASLLNLLQPAIGTLVSRYILNERVNDLPFFAAIGFLVVTLMLRYFHESRERIHAFLLIEVQPNKIKSVIDSLMSMREIIWIWKVVGGKYALIVRATMDSNRRLKEKLSNEIRAIDGIKKMQVLEIFARKKGYSPHTHHFHIPHKHHKLS